MAKSKSNALAITAAAILSFAAILSGCGSAMESGAGVGGSGSLGGSQSVNCDTKLIPAFNPYYTVLKQQCNACHVQGGPGNGAFADANLTNAFNIFKQKTESKVYTYAIDANHKAPFSGPENIPLLDQPKQIWNTAMVAYNDCMGTPGGGGGGGSTPPPGGGTVAIFTQNRTVNLVAGAAGMTVTWLLDSELVNANPDLAGAKLTALIEGNGSVNPYVVISNIQITGGTTSLYARNVGVKIADTLVAAPTGATFSTAERYIPKAATRNLAKSGGAMVVPVASLTNIQIALGFEKLEQSKLDGFVVDFDPPTHTQLVSNNAPAIKQIFNLRCTSCHNAGNAKGGVDLTNYNSIFGREVIPFDPERSLIFNAIATGAMPPTGALPTAEKDSVRFWILDGAPR